MFSLRVRLIIFIPYVAVKIIPIINKAAPAINIRYPLFNIYGLVLDATIDLRYYYYRQ
jgi:hypothetical protein